MLSKKSFCRRAWLFFLRPDQHLTEARPCERPVAYRHIAVVPTSCWWRKDWAIKRHCRYVGDLFGGPLEIAAPQGHGIGWLRIEEMHICLIGVSGPSSTG